MNEWETCIAEWSIRCRELQLERDALKLEVYDQRKLAEKYWKEARSGLETPHPQRGDGMKPLVQELEILLNGYSEESESNTPDFILATYLLACLENFNVATRERDRWYGVHLEPGNKYFKKDEAT